MTRREPARPGRRRRLLALLVLMALAAVVARLAIEVPSYLYLVYVGITLLIGAVAATTLAWMLDAWVTPESVGKNRFEESGLEPVHSFSLIVPARHEEKVLQSTLENLLRSDHPSFEILVVVGADDPATLEVAEGVATSNPGLLRVVIDPSWPKNKPKALNIALPDCRGDVVGVFDAEDVVHPALLRRVDQCLQQTAADVVQAGVQLMNFHSSWITVHNVLEYYFWFRSRLHLHARQRFIPLGGNTVFVRAPVLQAVGGWDPDCLAEDCELGVRLSSLGAHTTVFYEPDLVTREECPPTLRAFVRQRTRWNQGYLQTLSKGYWRRLPARQRLLGVYILAMPFLMAVTSLLIPAAIASAIAVRAPAPITLLSFVPTLPMIGMLMVELAGLQEFCRTYGERVRLRDRWRLVAGLVVYQGVLCFAAARAVFREIRGVHEWEKTSHLGLHLDLGPSRGGLEARGHRGGEAAFAPVSLPLAQAARQASPQGTTWGSAVAGPMATQVPWSSPASSREAWDGGRRFDQADGKPLWTRLAGSAAQGVSSLALPSVIPIDLRGGGEVPLAHLVSRIGAWLKAHVDLAVAVPLLCAVGVVQATNMSHWPAPMFDEGTYVGYAWAVGERGVLANYTYGYGHPPLGWVCIALWTWVSGLFGQGTYSISTARELMWVVSMASFALVYVLGRRLKLNPVCAGLAVIIFSLSPLSVFFHRAVLLDNPATMWAVAAFVLAMSPRRRLWSYAGSGACFAASVLSKETTLLMLPALVLAGFYNADVRTRRYCMTLLLSFFFLIGLSFPLYATLKGELVPGPGHVSLIGTDIVQLFTRKATGSVFNPHSLTRGTVMSWLTLDPWLPAAGIVLSPIALARRATRPIAVCLLIQVAMILRPGYLPAMYVVAQLPFAALVVAGSLQFVWDITSARDWRVAFRGRRLVDPPRVATRRARIARLGRAIIGCAVMSAGAIVSGVYVAPRWIRMDRQAMTVEADAPTLAAGHWLLSHVGHAQRLIVSDNVWIYLIEHGFNSQAMPGGFYSKTVVFFFPLDKDPAVRRYFPYSWREFDYVVETPGMRETASQTDATRHALAHSKLVASFGRGRGRIDIRAITPSPLGGIAAPNARQYRTPVSGPGFSLARSARVLGVNVADIVAQTNRHADPPSWWLYEAKHRFDRPLPGGTTLYYTKAGAGEPGQGAAVSRPATNKPGEPSSAKKPSALQRKPLVEGRGKSPVARKVAPPKTAHPKTAHPKTARPKVIVRKVTRPGLVPGEGVVSVRGQGYVLLGKISGRRSPAGHLVFDGYNVGGRAPVYFGNAAEGLEEGTSRIRPGNLIYTPLRYSSLVTKTPTARNQPLP